MNFNVLKLLLAPVKFIQKMSDLFGLSRVYLNVSKMRILEQLILKQEDRSLFIAAKNGEL